MTEQEQADFDNAMKEYFELMFDKIDEGVIIPEQALEFLSASIFMSKEVR